MFHENNFNFDFEKYAELLKAVASMSRLYSDSNTAFIHSRFIEKLYVYCSNARDLSRKDVSFDATLNGNIGVGIKTFVAPRANAVKSEKIAEFTRNAKMGDFANLDSYSKAKKASDLRNKRIISDTNEYEININKSIYHCLVRCNGYAFIHEEPYNLIDIDSIKPTNSNGIELKNFTNDNEHVHFTDNISKYKYDVSKNVLYKKFDLKCFKNSKIIPLLMYEAIFEKILKWTNIEALINANQFDVTPTIEPVAGTDFVVLPLYSTKMSSKEQLHVAPQSGINQWNANGRERKFGEAYIPIPQEVHKKYPNFFPKRDVKFQLRLPNGKVIRTKVCQDNSKALMSDPNTDLCDWLFNLIDKNRATSMSRFQKKQSYLYQDLKNVGKDSVKITKVTNQAHQYEIESMPLNSYEEFINDRNDDDDV